MSTTDNNSAVLIAEMRELDRKFRKACKQVVILNTYIQDLKTRYERAARRNQRRFRCAIRLRLATYEGVRNMYYEYASRKCDEIEELQDRLMECESTDEDNESEGSNEDIEV